MSDPIPCAARNGAFCELYVDGHCTHWIHAERVGGTPWGWRDAVVSGVDGGWITATYVESGCQVQLWHHADLAGEAAGGEPVRVHEQYHVLGGPFGWLNVVVRGGLGAVPEPADPAVWAPLATGGVQDLSTGRALALDWVGRQSS